MKNIRAYLSDIKAIDAEVNRVHTIHVDYSETDTDMNEIEFQNESRIYASLRINFTVWDCEGAVYGYKKLIRLPRKIKKELKNSIIRDFIKEDRTYIPECPKAKKIPVFSYKQPDDKCGARIENCKEGVYT